MMLSADAALHATACLLGVSLVLQSLELLSIRRELRDDGVFAWPVLRDDYARAPAVVRVLFDASLAYRPFVGLLLLQTVVATALPWCPGPWPVLALLLTALLVCVRFRGTYNGGSDAMTIVVLLGLLIARSGEDGTRATGSTAARVGLGYITAQLVLSYVVAGLAKLREPAWRRGHALPRLLSAHQYEAPPGLRAMARRPALGLLASWAVITFECAFPSALFHGPRICLVWLTLGLTFHALNALTLGLNRFLWAWLAAYPALLFWSERLAGPT